MANSLLEQTRGLHEEMERLERLVVKDFKQDVRTHKEKLMQSHRVKRRLDGLQGAAAKLLRIYEDEDGGRREDIAALAVDPNNMFTQFYDRLREIRDYHRRYPSADLTEAEDSEALLKEEVAVEFSGEECMGRCLDLVPHHQTFINTKWGAAAGRPDYLAYVSSFADFSSIPRLAKLSAGYREYLAALAAYLMGFHDRTQPLVLLDRQLAKAEEEARGAWAAGTLSGWEDRAAGSSAAAPAPLIDLEAFDSAEELETVGVERLKDALTALGLKAGGTPAERAARLFLTKSTPLEALDRKHFVKGAAAPRSEAEAKKQEEAGLAAALLEARVRRLAELLAPQVSETRARVEKRQAQTYEELVAEQEEAAAEAAPEADSDEEEYIYNPLKLPLGWDGKPIPYWLYKLHGLNQEFKCEICGNYSYWGRRAFERHFREWRHINGMKALGIPNTKQFYEVTRIDDAVSLHKALQDKARGDAAAWDAGADEELEDNEGNVYNRKTYEDLRRQGLI